MNGRLLWVSWALSAQDTAGNTFNTVSGIRYAEFVKLDSDLRWRHVIHEKSSLAFRIAAGIGMPYGNLTVLPFESSFFVGGANGLRAWRARSIGPGSYSAPLLAYDRIGEIRLEGNAEYRFKLIGIIEGALFTDIGNIWELKKIRSDPVVASAIRSWRTRNRYRSRYSFELRFLHCSGRPWSPDQRPFAAQW
ncbi:MAG: BamA/TamA family outer membrane protein [Flavobacteriales bacterium]|nr:BamA/TamA family outer membrane protein [Flavobacteriales bacterium]